MLNLAKAQPPVSRKKQETIYCDPFELPEAGDDTRYTYVRTMKPESPLEACHVGGLTFQKRCLPPEASLLMNADKRFDFLIPTVSLTEKQAEAYKARADKKKVRIPPRPNPQYDGKNDELPELESYMACLGEELILEKVSEFGKKLFQDPVQARTWQNPEKEEEDTAGELEKFKDELVKQQRKPKK